MKIVKLHSNISRATKEASRALSRGALIVYPTDTCYGLGVNALDKKAINKLYEVKKRSPHKPTHVVVRDWQMIESLCRTNDLAKRLYDKHLPGPLTIILKKKPHVPDELTGGLHTLGVRIPHHKFTQKLMGQVDFPITTPSANEKGEPPPYSIDKVKEALDPKMIDLVIDAGKLTITPPSTLVDVSENKLKILRKGPVSKKGLLKDM
ncbi:L-threonylcarbamoyladenylate synthase [Patescibacteria group bacterium]